MSGYYYLDNPESELGYAPVSEDEMVSSILAIAKSHGVNISDKMILDQIQKNRTKSTVLNFSNKFRTDRKLPRQLKILSIKKPRMVNIRGR